MGPTAVLGLCLVGCLALSPCLSRAQAEGCRGGWLALGGHCFGYFPQELSWRKAEAWCRATRGGGHLASLHSPEEHRGVAAFIARRREEEEEEEEAGGAWIGLFRRSRAWTWVDGSPQRYSAGEGDDAPAGRLCAALEESAGFLSWEEESCSERKPFVCKYTP